jgi:hypothetical protein
MRKKIQYAKNFFHVVAKDPARKSYWLIVYEILILSIRQKSFPIHYFSRFLYRKGSTDIFSYVKNNVIISLQQYFNKNDFIQILENKILFHLYFRDSSVNTPKLLAYNQYNVFFVDNEIHKVNSTESFSLLLHRILNETSESGILFIKLAISSHGGKEIFRVSLSDLTQNTPYINKLYKIVSESIFIFEDLISQHPQLNELNPSCINSLRIASYFNTENEAEILSGFLRVGSGKSFVDNTSQGGFAVGIEENESKLKEFGYSSISIAGGKIITRHPDTNQTFKDYSIPFLKEAYDMVLCAARMLPSIRLVGWDIAIGSKGPVLIEGNHDFNITSLDLCYGGYYKNPVFKKVLDDYQQRK